MDKHNLHTWLERVLIGIVLLFNVQCALAFLIAPDSFSPSFELYGAVGAGMVRGMGILFLMWNVPYMMAFIHPLRWRVSLYEALVMQAIGVIGETLLLLTFPPGHPIIQTTLGRFIAFDVSGLLLLLLAAWLVRTTRASVTV